MSVLGPLAKGLAFLMGKQPEEQRQPRGCLGLEWSEQMASGRTMKSTLRLRMAARRSKLEFESTNRSRRLSSRSVFLRQERMCTRFLPSTATPRRYTG